MLYETIKWFSIDLNDPATAAKFSKLHNKIEQMCKWIYFGLFKITASVFVLPVLIITISNYFILDLGERSFFLSSPIWYVLQSKRLYYNKSMRK